MADQNWMAYLRGRGQNFNPYGAGDKQYGVLGAPNVGPTSSPEGYDERDLMIRARRNALLRRLKAGQGRRYMSSEYLTPNDNR
jgi:hypothetical protein